MTRILNLNNSVDIIANTISLIDGNDIIDINNLFSHSSEIDNYYTITDIDNIIDNYYTKQQIDISLGDYYTIQQLNTSFSNYYIISQIDNLLNDKANQSTTYTKTETDNEITVAVTNSYNLTLTEVYTKANVDSLMSLKAPLTDTYTRSMIDAGLLLKADQATTYTKSEIDALNAGMYLKNEVNNLLDLKLNSSNILNYYNKTELDSMFANYYTRSYLDVVFGNIDNLLIDKANQSTTYTKNEIDALNAGMYWQYQVNDLFYNKTEIDNIIGNIASSSVENETPYYSGTSTLVPDTIPLVSANGKIKPLIGADDITVIDNGTYSTIHASFHASSSGGVGEILVAGDGTIKPIDVTGNISITSDVDNVTINVPYPQSEFNVVGESIISSNGKLKTLITQSPLQISNDNTSVTIGFDANDFAYQTTTYTKTETDNLLNDKADQATTYTKQEVDTSMYTKEPLNTALYPVQKGFDLTDPNNIVITLGLDQNFLDDVAGKQDAITDSLSIQGSGDVLLELKADTDNSNENDNPMMRLSQDDGRCATDVGMQETDNSFYINYNNGTSDVSSIEFLVFNRGNLQTYLTNTSTGWVSTSDERLKNVIAPITNTLENLDGINPVYYNFKADSNETVRLGLMAQEVEKIYPECVQCDPTGNLGIVYQDMIPVLLAAIKELTARVATLEKGKSKKKNIKCLINQY